MTKTLIKARQVVCLDEGDHVYEPGYVVVEGTRIAEVGPQSVLEDGRFDEVIDLPHKLLMPGLVNAHTHSPMSLFRGRAEGHSLFNFEGWYNTIRVIEQVMTPDMLPPAVALSCAEMIRTGTTCFADGRKAAEDQGGGILQRCQQGAKTARAAAAKTGDDQGAVSLKRARAGQTNQKTADEQAE